MPSYESDPSVWNREEPQPIVVPLLGRPAVLGPDYNQRDYSFVGRDLLINDIRTTLEETRHSGGCYLISGYRGSGKTTLVTKAILLYERRGTYPAWIPRLSCDKTGTAAFLAASARGQRMLDKCRPKPAAGVRHTHTPPQYARAPAGTFVQPTTGDRFRAGCLNLLLPLRSWPIRWAASLRRRLLSFRRPVVRVKINLGQDEGLTVREVMFDVANLLHREVRLAPLYPAIVPVAILTVASFRTIACLAPGWLDPLVTFTEILPWSTLNAAAGTNFGRAATLAGLLAVLWYAVWTRILPTNARAIRILKELNRRMAHTVELNTGIRPLGFSLGHKESMPPLAARQIEAELLRVLRMFRRVRWWCGKRLDIIFIFDELDKIGHPSADDTSDVSPVRSMENELRERKRQMDHLLGAIKNFISTYDARFFFVAGREMLDSYQAERGSTSSLYESLFTRTFELPSLLTDASDNNREHIHSMIETFVCRAILHPDIAIYLWSQSPRSGYGVDRRRQAQLFRDLRYAPFCLRTYHRYLHEVGVDTGTARRAVLILRNFIQFLTLHSWGNPKRLQSLFLSFTKSMETVDWRQRDQATALSPPYGKVRTVLQFGLIDQQRIVLASNLYIQLYHVLGRQLASSGDKLAVSTMAAFQYILKFHRSPFSRYHLETMSETINIYRSPELKTMVDMLLSKVLRPHIRHIRHSHYRYRFNGYFEQEMRYISRVSDVESAAFNFSLDATSQTKAKYLDELKLALDTRSSGATDTATIYELCMYLGDLFALEQSYNDARRYYQMAVDVLAIDDDGSEPKLRHLRVESLLRLGEVFEHRQSYDQAASVYLSAMKLVDSAPGANDVQSQDGPPDVPAGSSEPPRIADYHDSKWDVYRQPFWAFHFLHLKRGPAQWRDRLPSTFDYPPQDADKDPVNCYRAARLAFLFGRYGDASGHFLDAIRHTGGDNLTCERAVYLNAYARLGLAGSSVVEAMSRIGPGCHMSTQTLRKDLTDQGRKLVNQFAAYLRVESVGGLSGLMERSSARRYVEECLARTEDSSLGRGSDEDTSRPSMTLQDALGVMVHAGESLETQGLYYHAANAYLSALALWGMVKEILNVLLTVPDTRTPEVDSLLRASSPWVADLRMKAAVCIACMTRGDYSRFQSRWKYTDIGLTSPELSSTSVHHPDFAGIELAQVIEILFPDDRILRLLQDSFRARLKPIQTRVKQLTPGDTGLLDEIVGMLDATGMLSPEEITVIRLDLEQGQQNIDKVINYVEARVSDPKRSIELTTCDAAFSQRSLMGQNLIAIASWEDMLSASLRDVVTPLKLQQRSMVPHTTRSLMFAHWLSGRHHADQVRRALTGTPLPEDYDRAAMAIHSYYRASYYLRQLAGNDQELMFPYPSMVLYDLWLLLYSMVRSVKQEIPDIGYRDAAETVKIELSGSTLRRDGAPANHYDLQNVCLRLKTALVDAAHLGDVSNRVRTDAVRTKSYLADDYEDPRFILDWTMVHMYSPFALFLRAHVERAMEELNQ